MWTEPGWAPGDLIAHAAPSWPSSPARDPSTQSPGQQVKPLSQAGCTTSAASRGQAATAPFPLAPSLHALSCSKDAGGPEEGSGCSGESPGKELPDSAEHRGGRSSTGGSFFSVFAPNLLLPPHPLLLLFFFFSSALFSSSSPPSSSSPILFHLLFLFFSPIFIFSSSPSTPPSPSPPSSPSLSSSPPP